MAKKSGPCWEGYEMIGMKKKGSRTVPNCVPVKKKFAGGLIPDPSTAIATAQQSTPQTYISYRTNPKAEIKTGSQQMAEMREESKEKEVEKKSKGGMTFTKPIQKAYYKDLI